MKLHLLLPLLVFSLLAGLTATAQNYTMGNSTISACSGNFYDSGGGGNGSNANYSNSENYTMTFCPSTSGQCVRLTFSAFDIESGFDFLRVYNGPSTASPLIGTYTGTTSPATITATTGCITLQFTSDGSVNRVGWTAAVSCVPCPTSSGCNGGPAPANDACTGAMNLGTLPTPAACPNGLGTVLSTPTTNLCATAELPYTSLNGCQPSGNMASPSSDVWYTFTISGPTLNVGISGLISPQVGLYAGNSCTNMIPRGCGIGTGGTLNTTFGSLAPGRYYLQVSGGTINDQGTFTLNLQNNNDCAGCVIQSAFTATPPPVNGTYQAGQNVTFCYTITNYNQTSSNWLHAVIPTFGAGWNMATLTTTPATRCATSGAWNWYNSSFTSSATGLNVGPGFFFETAAGSATGTMDANPGNNFGDNNFSNLCDWTFCWSVTTLPPNQCIPGANLNITVDTYGDGETGSWGSFACSGDPITQFFAELACCSPPIVNDVPIPCPGGTGGAIATGQGISPWNYVWRNNAGTIIQQATNVNGSNTISNLAAGTYTVTVTDDAGCTSSASFTLTAPAAVTINGNPVNPACSNSSNGSITATPTGGTTPYTYSWSPGGATTATLSGLAAGSYTVTVTDANGCTATRTFTLTTPSPVAVSTTPTGASCYGTSTGSATASPSGGTPGYTYSWSPSGGTGATANNLSAGNYTVTVTDSRGCTSTATALISEPSQLTSSITNPIPPTCSGSNNGSATAVATGGTPGYSYSWSPTGGSTSSPNTLGPGAYTVTVTDSRGCTSTASVTLAQPPVIVPVIQNNIPASCNGNADGSLSVSASGGTPGYTYIWQPSGGTSSTAVNLASGNYTVTVTDAQGCTATVSAAVTQPAPLTASTAPTAVSCNGLSDGSATVTPSGGTGPYTYNWLPSGGTGNTANLLSAGAYTVTVTDANGCSTSRSVNISEPTAITYTSTTTPATCGLSDGSATVTPSGGSSPYTYSWSPSGGSGSTATNLPGGGYTVTITDAQGCTVDALIGVSNTGAPIANISSSTSISCASSNTGSATVTATGGAAPYTYLWSPTGGTNATASGLSAGTYTVTVFDANGCNSTATVNIFEPAPLTSAILSFTDATCSNLNNGSATVLATGGTAGYTYSWSPTGATGATRSNLAPGSYTITVTDAVGCTSTTTVSIGAPPALTAVISSSTNILCNGSNNGSASVTPGGGTAPYTYAWSPSGGSGSSASGLSPGNYTVTVTDANGCTNTATTSITEPAPLTLTTTPVDVSCNGAANGSVTASPGGGSAPFSYAWSPSGGTGSTANNLGPGTYTVTMTDANGCTATSSATITEPGALQVSVTGTTNVLCAGTPSGTATASASGGQSPITYAWSPSGGNNAAATGLAGGNYTVTVTDANGCTSTATATINQPPPLNASINSLTNVLCANGATGSANVSVTGGVAAYLYSWAPTGGSDSTATGLSGGTYTVTITDGNGCTVTRQATINEPPPIVLSTNSSNATCGNTNGSASVTASGGAGGYSYSWSPSGGTSASATGLGAGTYTVEVTDANGCIQRTNVTLSNSLPPIPAVTVNSNVPCNGGSSGSATVAVSQGTSPVSIDWNPTGGTGTTASNLSAGFYSVTVTDALGCTGTANFTITEPPALTATTSATDVICNGAANGTGTVSVNGGTAQYAFAWSPGGYTDSIATTLSGGAYTVTVTDAAGCTITSTVNIIEPPVLVPNATPTNVTCSGATNGSLTGSATGGTPGYTYNWSPGGSTGLSLNNLNAGTYTLTVTDANGCTATLSTNITEPAPLVAAISSSSQVTCFGSGNGSATASVSGGTSAYTYAWSPAGGTGTSAGSLGPGTYTVNVTDANGCTATASVNITEPPLLTAGLAASTPVSCNGGSDGSASISASGGTPSYNYAWSPSGGSGTNLNGATAGNYTVTVTDANGCTASTSFAIAEPPLLTAAITATTDVNCFGEATGQAVVAGTGGTPALTYSWAPSGGTTAIGTSLTAGSYTVTVSDANGCTATATTTITEPPILSVTISTSSALCGNSNGSISASPAGGSGSYTYSWSPGGATTSQQTGLSGGNFTVTVTDGNGCTVTSSSVVPNIPGPTAVASTLGDVSCNGGNNGSASVSISAGTAPIGITWSPTGGTGTTATGLSAGTYTVLVTDANGCTSTGSAIISEPPLLSAQTTASDALCNGATNGSAGVTASGGTSPLTYSWSPGGSGAPQLTNLAAGTYTVTITDANGCTLTSSASVQEPPLLTLSTISNDATCAGSSNGSATATVSGGTPVYTYAWFPSGGTGSIATGLTAGSYSVTISDLNGCQTSTAVNIGEPAPVQVFTTTTPSLCGNSDGTASTTVSGGTAPYTYVWSPGNGTTANLSGLAAGGYSVVVTDLNGCTATDIATVSNTGGPIAAASLVANVSCTGGNDGSATVTVNSGTAPYTYSWSPSGSTSQIATGLPAGNYSVNVIDANGCVTTDNVTVNEPSPVIVQVTSNPTFCSGSSDGSTSASAAGGTGPYNYSWNPGGIAGATAFGLSAGNYSVTVTDANGCTATSSVAVQQPSPLNLSATQVNASCNGSVDGNSTVTVTGGTAGYSYNWFPTGGNGPTGTGLAAGTYAVTVTDGNGCSSSLTVNISEPSAITAQTSTSPATCGTSNGSASVTATSGAGGYSYSWSPGNSTSATATGLSGGPYTVTITDANGCTNTAVATVSNVGGPAIQANLISNVQCAGGADGSATVVISSGTAPYTYSWSPSGGTSATATGLPSGIFTVTVTDANGCLSTDNLSITEPLPINLQTNTTPAQCFGSSDGSASVSVAGGNSPYSYSWSNGGGTGSSANNLPAGNYTVTVTDGNGCISTASASVAQPASLSLSTSSTPAGCNGSSDGSASVTVTGGTTGYAYNWFPSGGSGSTALNLLAGNYTVTVTDANGCTMTAAAAVSQPAPVSLSTTTTNATCGTANGSASVAVSGGQSPYSYSWAPGGSTIATAGSLSAGAYTVTVTDANGCSNNATASISNTGGPSINASVLNDVSCSGANDGSASVNVFSGTSPYIYSWSPSGGNGQNAVNLLAGTYTITVTDANGCLSTDNVIISQPTPISAQVNATPASCYGGTDGNAAVTVSGGSLPYSYFWSPSGGNSALASNLTAGTYSVTVTDIKNCSITLTTSISQPAQLAVTTAVTPVSCNGGNNGSITAQVIGGSTGYNYSWFPSGGNGFLANGLAAGSYTVSITDANGCSASASASVSEPAAILLQTSSTPATCGSTNGTASVSANGGSSPYTYSWSPGNSTGSTATGLSAGAYSVLVTDNNGCVQSANATVSNTGGPVITASVVSQVSCFGGNNGSAIVNIASGTAPYSYSWGPSGGNTALASGLGAGTYVVNVEDANGCVSTSQVSIQQPASIAVQGSSVPADCYGTSTGSATATISGGTSPFTYSWSPSGSTTATATGLAAGNYTVLVTDANGCTSSGSATVAQPNRLQLITTSSPASCNGSSDGTASVSISGGTAGFTYSWFPSGGNASTSTPRPAGSYTVTVTDANGCTASSSATISQPAPIQLQTSTTPASCGSNNGSASVNASGGVSPFNYSWIPGNGASNNISGLTAGSYTVTVTDANGCTNTALAAVSNIGGPTITASVTQPVSCFGTSTGAASVTVSSGTSPYTYLWTPSGNTGSTASNLSAGTYGVTVIDANGCISTSQVTLNQPVALVSQTVSTPALCFGSATGEATVTSTGGTSPYSYSWTPSGGTARTATNLSSGTYIATTTDANGCTSTSSITVTQPAALSLTTTATAVTCNGGNNGSASVSVSGGTAAYNYSWFPTGGNSSVANGLAAGTYTVSVTDANGCTSTNNTTVAEPSAMVLQTSSQPASCGSSNGSVTVTASGGSSPYNYAWSPSGGFSATAANLPAGSYLATVTDANGCSNTATATISNSGGPSAIISNSANVSCNGAANGSATANVTGGTFPLTYLWTPYGGNSTTANGLSGGTYTFSVIDANGCSSFQTITIQEPTALNLQTSVTPAACGSSNGSATVLTAGGTPSYTYSWSPSGATTSVISNQQAGTYTVTVTDAGGCTQTATASIGSIGGASATLQQSSDVSCFGGSDGSAVILANGGTAPYTYLWSPNGGTTTSATGLSAGLYNVSITDANGCISNVTVFISEPDPIIISTTSTPAACNGGTNGSATASVFGGTAPYLYQWSPSGGTGPTANNLSQGIYAVTVTDSRGCSETETAQVNSASTIQASTTVTNVSCYGQQTGTASVNSSGGTPPYSYQWSTGSTTTTASGLGSGAYTITVTDATGCSTTQNAIIAQPPQLTLSTNGATTLCNSQIANLAAQAAGGTTPYSYLWSNGSTDSTLSVTPLQSTVFTVSVTDANGCTTAIQTIPVNVLTPLQVTATGDDTICGGTSVPIQAVASGGDGNYTFSWNNGAIISASSIVTPVHDTTFMVTVLDGCGTPVYDQVTIVVRPTPVTDFSPASIIGCVPITVNFNDLSSAPPGSSYSWDFGDQQTSTETEPQHTYTEAGEYSVSLIITSPEGCTDSRTINNLVQAYGFPAAGFTQTASEVSILNSGVSFQNTSEGAVAYSWDFGDGIGTSDEPNPSYQYEDTGTYTVQLIVTNPAGCVDTVYGTIRVTEDFAIYIPNAFTPNGDGVNDTFNAFGVGYEEFDLYIIDRWGLPIFHSTDKDQPWDGTVRGNGNPCQADVYEYIIKVTDFRGRPHKYIGHVTLVR